MYYEIVPMNRSHVDQVAALERACFSMPWSETQLADALYDDNACFLVAEDDEGNVIGYAGLSTVLDEGYINNIAVEEAARKHGVASALLDTFCRFGELNLAFLTLEVRKSNAAAIGLYEKYGFEQVGVRPGFYQRPREDAVIMTRYFQQEEGQE